MSNTMGQSDEERRAAVGDRVPAAARDDIVDEVDDARLPMWESVHAGLAVHRPVHGTGHDVVDFECTYINPAGARLFHSRAADLIGRRISAFEPARAADVQLHAFDSVIRTGAPVERELRFEHLGRETVLQLSAVRIGHAVAATFSDLTWPERAEADVAGLRVEVERAARRATRILERMSDAHVTLDAFFRILSVNAAAARALGRPASRLVGRSYRSVAPGLMDSDAARLCRQVLTDRREGQCMMHVAGDGSGQYVELDAYPTEEGGVALFWRDVTARVTTEAFRLEFAGHLASWSQHLHESGLERARLLENAERARQEAEAARAQEAAARGEAERMRAEAEWARINAEHARAQAESARAQAESANRAKTEFLAVMSHELRTPLNAIGGYAELMELGLRGPITDVQREDLSRIQRSQRHLLGLINAVLNYARLETASVTYDIADVSVQEAIAAATSMLVPQTHAMSLTLHVIDPPADMTVRADPEKLRQILVNLLTNAVKFTRELGEITVSAALRGADVAISVSDTGVGISEAQHKRIFDPFVQVDTGLTRTQEGVGLGLAISRDLARAMGGDLTVQSVVGAGSTFTVRLPTKDGAPEAERSQP